MSAPKKFTGTPGGILPGSGAAGVMKHRINNTGGRVPAQGTPTAGGPIYDGGVGPAGGGAFPPGVGLGNKEERKRWKPFGAGIVEKLNPWYLVVVLLLICAYGWIGSRPLHHMIGKEITVIVDSVVDGDTFSAKTVDLGISARFRLRNIDAPERDQPFGIEAKIFLEDLIQPDFAVGGSTSQAAGNREVIVLLWEQDDWGRYVVDVVTRDSVYTKVTFVQQEMVKEGLAWVFGGFSKNQQGGLGELSEKAKADKKGLFKQEHPVEPWRHRHQQRLAKERGEKGKRGGGQHQPPRGKNYNSPPPSDMNNEQYDGDQAQDSRYGQGRRNNRRTASHNNQRKSHKAGGRRGHS